MPRLWIAMMIILVTCLIASMVIATVKLRQVDVSESTGPAGDGPYRVGIGAPVRQGG